MPFCENCGHEVNEDQIVCLNCGSEIKSQATTATTTTTTSTSVGNTNDNANTFALVGFILSFFGGIIGLVFCILGLKAPDPTRAKLAKAGIFISIGVFVLIVVIEIISVILNLAAEGLL